MKEIRRGVEPGITIYSSMSLNTTFHAPRGRFQLESKMGLRLSAGFTENKVNSNI